MKLALIPPIELLEYTGETFCQLMLPQLLENEVYKYVYLKHCEDSSQYVILDNGANEGEDYGIDDLVRLADIYQVDEIVLPDVIRDPSATRAKAMTVFKVHPFPQRFKYMYVLQGTNWDEFVIEAIWALAQPEVDVIGIPRHMIATCKNPAARYRLADQLFKWAPDRPVHLLGGAPSVPFEIKVFNWPTNVRSHDTSSPFNFAYYGYVLDGGHVECKRPDKYFTQPASEFDIRITDRNVRRLMEWTGNDV